MQKCGRNTALPLPPASACLFELNERSFSAILLLNQTTPIPDGMIPIDPRVAEILASVRHAFTEKGFDGATMQDLARAAGMSVGNFYRYFRSKADIVAAMIESDLCKIEAEFAELKTADTPFERLKAGIRDRLPMHQTQKDGDLWAEISAAAQRNDQIGAAALRMEARLNAAMLGVIAHQTGLPMTEAAARFGAEADFILLLFKAASCLGGAESTHRNHLNALIFRSIDQTLDSIAQMARIS
jgi:AcrR family transcriptional regulator